MLGYLWRGVLGLVAFVLVCEAVLQVLPVSTSTATGYHTDPLVVTYPAHHRWTLSTGWQLHNPQHLESNNAGFLADVEFQIDPNAVALVGDSFAEATMLDAPDRPAEQLRRALHGRPVYALGSAGSALLDYVERIRLVRQRYGVRNIVVMMERGDVRQSLCGSSQTQGPCVDRRTLQPRTETLPPPGAIKRALRHSALAQYIAGNLKFDATRLFAPAAVALEATPVSSADVSARSVQSTTPYHYPPPLAAVATLFFERVKGLDIDSLCIVLDSDRAAIYREELIHDPDRADFIGQARRAGFTVIDTEPLYRAAFAKDHLRLDVGPYDGHLNPLGVRIAMEAAARALQAR